jgi:coenzyme PQQ synthesis protein D (PqqD)
MSSAAITPESRVRRNQAILVQALEDEFVLGNTETGSYYALTGTGKRIWDLLAELSQVSAICSKLASEYGIAPETSAQHVLAFLNDMRSENLILLVE